MKFTPADYEFLLAQIRPFDTPARRYAYANGQFRHADRTADNLNRYRWDLFWAARDAANAPAKEYRWKGLSRDYNDSHIVTALRHAVPSFSVTGIPEGNPGFPAGYFVSALTPDGKERGVLTAPDGIAWRPRYMDAVRLAQQAELTHYDIRPMHHQAEQ